MGTVEPGGASDFSDVPLHTVDIRTGNDLAVAFNGASVVVHLAARNHALHEKAENQLAEFRKVNVDGTRNVIRAAYESGVKLFIHLSSVKAMREESKEVLDENSPCFPKTPYGISKLESEEAVRTESAINGMNAVILRLPMVYGPRNWGNIQRMIRWADRGLPVQLPRPENIRSMAYVENVVAGISALLKNPTKGVATYILKDREDYSTRILYSTICRHLGKKPRFFTIPAALVAFGGRISEDFRKVTGSFRVSSGRIEKDIGFIPPYSLEEGIARTVQWYKNMNCGRAPGERSIGGRR